MGGTACGVNVSSALERSSDVTTQATGTPTVRVNQPRRISPIVLLAGALVVLAVAIVVAAALIVRGSKTSTQQPPAVVAPKVQVPQAQNPGQTRPQQPVPANKLLGLWRLSPPNGDLFDDLFIGYPRVQSIEFLPGGRTIITYYTTPKILGSVEGTYEDLGNGRMRFDKSEEYQVVVDGDTVTFTSTKGVKVKAKK